MNELTRQCLYLSKEEKVRLIDLLKDSIEEGAEQEGRFATLLKAATDVCGEGILSRSREFKRSLGRKMIAYKMRKEGCTLSTIARRLVRDHASIVHMVHSMEDILAYPHCFGLEMEYWYEFNNKIRDYDFHNRSAQES